MPGLLEGITIGAIIKSIIVSTAVSVGVGLVTRFLAPRSNRISGLNTAGIASRQTIRAEIVNARWILGRRRVPGALCYWGSVGREARMGLILAEGPCDSIEQVWIDGHLVQMERSSDSAGDLLRPVAGSKYRDKIEIREYFKADGTQGTHMRQAETTTVPGGARSPLYDGYDPGDPGTHRFPEEEGIYGRGIYGPNPNEFTEHLTYTTTEGQRQFANYSTLWPRWTAQHRLNGVSWVYVKMTQPEYGTDLDSRFWSTIPTVEFLVKGLMFTWPGQTVKKWTENAAAVRYWWETSRRGRLASSILASDFTPAYNLCEEEVDATTGGTNPLPSGYKDYDPISKRYSINGVISSGDDPAQIEEQMDAAWAGEIIEVNGLLLFRPGSDSRVASLTLTEDDFLESPSVQSWNPLQQRINAVNCTLAQSNEHDYTQLSLPLYTDSDARTRDGVLRPTAFTYAFVADPIAAGRLQAINLRRSRESLRMRCVVKPGTTFNRTTLRPTDRVLVTNKEYGFANFRFAVERVMLRQDWSVELDLREDKPNTFADTLVLPPLMPRQIRFPQADQVIHVRDLVIDEIAAIANDGTTVVYLVISWTPSAVSQTEIRVREKLAEGDTEAKEWEIGSSISRSWRLPGVIAGKTYEVQARHHSTANVAGPWTSIVEHEVGGDLTPPAAPTSPDVDFRPLGFRATWVNPEDDDFASVCIYVAEGEEAEFDMENLVATVAADIYEHSGLIAGTTYRVWLKAKDNTGNLSEATEPINVTPVALISAGGKWHHGEGTPDETETDLTEALEGDLYVDENTGRMYQLDGEGNWNYTTIDITPEGNELHVVKICPPENPPASLGSNGDKAVSIEEGCRGTVWTKADGVWSETGNVSPTVNDFKKGIKEDEEIQNILKGPKGVPGDPGERGNTGDKGDKGPKGIEGNQGETGPMGDVGDKGEKGIQGTQGDTGPKGEVGVMGEKGIQGTQGDTGLKGESGDDGAKGEAGAKGVTGIQGVAGTKGDSGEVIVVYYTNAPRDTDPATLAPTTQLQNGDWNTVGGIYRWYADATRVPVT